MEPVVIVCNECGKALRVRYSATPRRRRACRYCHAVLPQAGGPAVATPPPQLSPEAETRDPIDPSPRSTATARSRFTVIGLLTLALVGALVHLYRHRGRDDFAHSASTVAPIAEKDVVPASKAEPSLVEPIGGRETPTLVEKPAPNPSSAGGPVLASKGGVESAAPTPSTTLLDPCLATLGGASRSRTSVSAPPSDRSSPFRALNDDGTRAEVLASPPPVPEPITVSSMPDRASTEPRKFKIRDEDGQLVVARLHGQQNGKTALILPDGKLGFPTMLVPTEEPFRPLTTEEQRARLQNGPLVEFQVHETPHYLIFYQSTHGFAEASGRLLEELYRRLTESLRKNGLPVHEAEFPLVAVIFRTERDFRAHKQIDPNTQAYYEIFTNRIYFYQSSERDQLAPEVTALRRPQTVAHEGTHQILQNIGVHPRLSPWPIWLIEGLAEYCATPSSSRKGITWDGLGMINALHMATIRELEDPLAVPTQGQGARSRSLTRQPGKPLVETLIRKSELTPTEYALAWAMTHYLAVKRADDFIKFLKSMSQVPPLENRTPDDQVNEFRKAFGQDLGRIDKAIDAYLRKLSRQKGYDPMPFYAVMFEQPLTGGVVRRAAMVSQSPQLIQQWINEISVPQGGMPNWQAFPHPTRARAVITIQGWMRGY